MITYVFSSFFGIDKVFVVSTGLVVDFVVLIVNIIIINVMLLSSNYHYYYIFTYHY